MSSLDQCPPFRVLIAGGGIAGLTLANCLQHAGIDYLLLEARSVLAPQLGASIGLGPNGSRILDQLGCYDDIISCTEPIDYTGSHRGVNGEYIRPKTDAFRLVQARANYCMCFIDRQTVLQILDEHIMDRQKVLLNKRIVRAEHGDTGVAVVCNDGTTYTGDILVGADGVHSIVRREMWHAAAQECPGMISEQEKNRMLSEYKCLYAISSPIPGLPEREFGVTYKKDISPIVITSKNGRVYWFLIARMPQVYRAGNIPRFTQDEAQAFVEENLEIPVMPGAKVTVGDLWRNRETYNLVALEEVYYSQWTWGRFVCLGDSIHKMTPNMGAGGNSAIESAAALANALYDMLNMTPKAVKLHPSVDTAAIQQALSQYQRSRSVRASATVKVANLITRLHAVRGLVEHILAHYIMPHAGDLLVDLASDSWIGAIRLEYMPIPSRSLYGTMPFNPQQGMGKNESLMWRALAATPLLAIGVYSFRTYGTAGIGPFTAGSSSAGLAHLADFGTVYAILLIESARRASLLTPMQMPIFFGIASGFIGAGTAMPFYYALYYSLVPISRFRATDLRLTDLSYTRSVLPAVLLAYHIPSLLLYLAPSAHSPQAEKIANTAAWVIRTSPLWIAAGQWILHRTVFPSTIRQDRIDNVTRDLGTIRRTVGSLAVYCAATYVATCLPRLFLPLTSPSHTSHHSFAPGQLEQVLFSGSSLLWIVYLFHDLKKAGMVRYRWVTFLASLTGSTFCLGPGAVVALAWLWREQILATKRHKGAIIARDGN